MSDPFDMTDLNKVINKSVDDDVAVTRPAPPITMRERLGPAAMPPFRRDTPVTAATVQPALPKQATDLELFMHSGEKMLELQRVKISAARTRYDIERTRITDDYRTQLEAIEHEGREKLRQLDIAHERELEEAEHLVDVLTTMRDVKRK